MAIQSGTPTNLLLAEDDQSVREALERALGFEGYEVHAVADGAQALEAVLKVDPEVIVLDVMMPAVDGLTACRRIREKGIRTPVLMLTARHDVADRVAGLDAGADDYLVKPFDLEELLARLRALVRRGSVIDVDGETDVISVEDMSLDLSRREVSRSGERIDLTKTEFELLALLMHNEGIVLTREVIYERIWGYDFETNSKSLDVYIGYLRRKTEINGLPRLIHTVRGVGYTARA